MIVNTVSSTSSTTSEFETKRTVRNKRWVHSSELQLGMYVQQLDRPWEETHFMFQGFKIDSFKLIRALRDASEYCLVETEKVARIPTKGLLRRCGALRSNSNVNAFKQVNKKR